MRLALNGGTGGVRIFPQLGVKRPGLSRSCMAQFDPNVWSGRASQEVFVELAVAVLHQCIRPLIGARTAPGHHGYQRACDLISGQASDGPFGSPVLARAGKTGPPSRLNLSQTSADCCAISAVVAPGLGGLDGHFGDVPGREGSAVRKNAPGNASQFVGERDGQHITV